MLDVMPLENAAAARWDDELRQDRRLLESESEAMSSALAVPMPPKNRWVILSWALRELWPTLELHLRKEKEVLFPKLRKFLGPNSGAVTLMEESQKKLREGIRHLAELVQDQDNLDWDRISLAIQGVIYSLEAHAELEDHLFVPILEARLTPKEMGELAAAFREVGERAHAEEGWPRSQRAASVSLS